MFHSPFWGESPSLQYIGNGRGLNFVHNPQNNDPIVLWDSGEQGDSCYYSDHMFTHNHEKYNELCLKHFGDTGQYWSGRDINKIQDFLRDYMCDRHLVLVRVEQHKNYSTGYPYWYFVFKREEFLCANS